MKQRRLVLPSAEYKLLCTRVLQRDGFKCRHCKFRNTLSAHHIIFRSQGGDDADWNLISLCDECHIRGVHARHLVIIPAGGDVGDTVDANNPVRFVRLHGWAPRH